MLINKKIQIIIFSIAMLFANISNAQNCYELVWSDEFNYSGLPDSNNWSFEEGGSGWGNNELILYIKQVRKCQCRYRLPDNYCS